ncbi:hypothetical protein [Thalassospira xiamenensis]|uniref:hypothetical protein n=1 Tax=Thalassospira xiamenensis TaxID=220697 RepID=UPI000DED6D75|nr:hypothetical protein [Thalassospira xiamenensis]RCK36172.1 hypothetical protein TH24_19000 [Thalassospira xiamenensis]
MSHAVKQDAIDAIAKLPDDASMDDIMYRLYVLENIRRGQADIAAGKTHDLTDVRKAIAEW